jgi:hypothetical protein
MHPTPPRRRAAIVHWPREAARRERLARDGVPCLLVLSDGTATPNVGRGEDWVAETTDEREVVRRLDQLAAVGRTPQSLVPPVLPPSLDGPGRRVAALLARGAGALVRHDVLATAARPAALGPTVAQVRRALAPLGWRIDAVPATGYVLGRSERR